MNQIVGKKLKWPSNGVFVENLIEQLRDERTNTMKRWMLNGNMSVEMDLTESRKRISQYFHIHSRPRAVKHETESDQQFKGGSLKTLNLFLDDGTSIPFLLGSPVKPDKPIRIVIALHGTNETMEYPIGNLSVPVRSGHENVPGFALPLIEDGCYVLSPDLPSFGRRFNDIAQFSQLAIMMGRTYMEKAVGEIMALVDWIQNDSELSSGSIGITGFSLGGQVATTVAACDPRIKSLVDLEGWSTYESIFIKSPEEIAKKVYICGGILGAIGDTWHLASVIAPRPQFRIATEEDQYNPISGVLDMIEIIKLAYRAFESEELLKLKVYLGKHDINPDIPIRIVEWFRSTLK